MPIDIVINSVIAALERMHVLGVDSELHAGALKALRSVRDALEEAKKEAGGDGNHDEQG